MNFLLVATLYLVLPLASFGEDEKEAPSLPNPAEAGAPDHWDLAAWDTSDSDTFWHQVPAASADERAERHPLSQRLPQYTLLDRQSEK